MEKIVIEIDNPTAEEFKKFSPETRSRFGETVAIALKKKLTMQPTNPTKNFLMQIAMRRKTTDLLKIFLMTC